jgi:peptidoglycan hydrolase-like protein with peptidoglycan-binding domain
MRKGHKAGPREGGQAEGSAREGESGRAQRDEPGTRDRGRAEGRRDSGKDQTMGQGQSDRDETRGSEDRILDKGKAHSQRVRQQSRQNQSGSGTQGQSAQDRNSGSGTGQTATQGQTNAPTQSQTTAGQTQTRTDLTTQQQTTLQQSVLHADNAPRVDVNSINFQVHTGVAVPSSISVVSTSTYPALIDTFPAYRDDRFFVVEDEVVFVDRDRRIVDVVPAGPRTRFSGGGHGNNAAIDLPPDDIRVVQRALIERGLLHGEADGVLGPKTREAISALQRQQGIQVSGSIDARTVSSLGVSSRLSQQANQSIGQSQSSTAGAQTSTTGKEQAGAAVDLPPEDIRVVQRVLIERGLLHGEADGVLGPETREAIIALQRQQGIQVSGSIDARTVSSLGVSGRLSQQANQSIGQSQSSPMGAQTSTTVHGQAGTGRAQTGQPQPSQQNATGQVPKQTTGQATNPPAQQGQPPTTGQSTAPNQSKTTGRAAPRTQSGNNPTASENVPSDAISLAAAICFVLLALALGAFIVVPAI